MCVRQTCVTKCSSDYQGFLRLSVGARYGASYVLNELCTAQEGGRATPTSSHPHAPLSSEPSFRWNFPVKNFILWLPSWFISGLMSVFRQFWDFIHHVTLPKWIVKASCCGICTCDQKVLKRANIWWLMYVSFCLLSFLPYSINRHLANFILAKLATKLTNLKPLRSF